LRPQAHLRSGPSCCVAIADNGNVAHDRVIVLACVLPAIGRAIAERLIAKRERAGVRVRGLGTVAPYDEGSLFENVNTPHDHARARGWVELNEKPFEDRITE
jgi:hypothetical protein